MTDNEKETTMEPTYVRTLEPDRPIRGWKLWADIWQHEDGTFGFTVQATDRRITDGAQAPYLEDVTGIEDENDANTAADLALRNVADGLRRTAR